MSTPERLDFPTLTAPGTLPKITSIFDFSDKALNELKLWLEMHPLAVQISQVLGFTQFTAQRASVIGAQTTTSVTYANLATTGPTLTGLPAGEYLVIVQAYIINSLGGSFGSFMSPSINGSTPADSDAAIMTFTTGITCQGISVQTVTGDNNTITAQYRVNGGTGTFQYRNLIVIRMGNP